MCRGYYTGRGGNTGRTVLAAWNWRGGKLSQVWTFDTYDGTPGNLAYRGQGNHSIAVADVDDDGKDEIIYGACVIDHDGTGLYSKGLGHGDAQHTSDLDPHHPGLETFSVHENPRHSYGAELCDTRTGEILWGLDLGDTGRGLAIDIDPRYPGHECWTNTSDGLYTVTGKRISAARPRSCNMGIWWDGDLLREILDGAGGGRRPPGTVRNRSNTPGLEEQPAPGQRLPRAGDFRRFHGFDRVGIIDKWNYTDGTVTRLVNGGFFDCVTIKGQSLSGR
jgi:rhamnogalacturonan endolyase